MTAITITRFTPDEYLALEREAERRSEFLGGEIRAMSGGSSPHSLIGINVGGELRHLLKGSGCRVYNNDLRVKCPTGLYTYPDASVVCEKPRFEDHRIDTLLNPLAIFEVLSPSTQSYDRGEKFAHYRTIPTLREYVLVSQDRALVEHRIRDGSGNWKVLQVSDLAQSVGLTSVRVNLPMTEIYANVDFPLNEESSNSNGAHKV